MVFGVIHRRRGYQCNSFWRRQVINLEMWCFPEQSEKPRLPDAYAIGFTRYKYIIYVSRWNARWLISAPSNCSFNHRRCPLTTFGLELAMKLSIDNTLGALFLGISASCMWVFYLGISKAGISNHHDKLALSNQSFRNYPRSDTFILP